MAAIVVRQLPDAVHRALKARAQRHRRSTEAEVREILRQAVRHEPGAGLGTALARLGRQFGGVELPIPLREPAHIPDFD